MSRKINSDKNQQKKNASFFFQAKMCNLFLEVHFMSFHSITATIDFTMNYFFVCNTQDKKNFDFQNNKWRNLM